VATRSLPQTTRIYPYVGNPNYNLTTDMANEAIDYLNRINELDPKKPFFLYYAPGGTHAPHHPTPEWIEKFKGKFSMGWNALRDEIFANQKKLGVIPQDAQLTPWPSDILKNWDDLTADEKKLFERQMEVYAAYLAYTDRRRHGQARQHADHLYQRGQWWQCRGLTSGNAQRDDLLQRGGGAGR
jgi:arylsulfatase A-like enzyme